jgi:hypothetical protein
MSLADATTATSTKEPLYSVGEGTINNNSVEVEETIGVIILGILCLLLLLALLRSQKRNRQLLEYQVKELQKNTGKEHNQ